MPDIAAVASVLELFQGKSRSEVSRRSTRRRSWPAIARANFGNLLAAILVASSLTFSGQRLVADPLVGANGAYVMALSSQKLDPRTLSAADVVRSGTIAGVAMIPVGGAFRFFDYRINEYGRKTLELLLGELVPPVSLLLMFLQHMMISVAAAAPLLLVLRFTSRRVTKIGFGLIYGLLFYVALNSLALPIAFGDPTPWELGASVVMPSLVVHLVYGAVVAASTREGGLSEATDRAA